MGAESGGLAATTALLAFERGGVVESFPLPGGWRRWVVLTDRLWHEAGAADLAGIVRDRTGIELNAASATEQERERTDDSLSTFAVRQHLASRMAAGRIALLGDAAHEVSPIGGQGMNLGWLDAAALAPALELAVRGGHELESRALREYDLRRRFAARRAVAQAAFNMQIGREASGARLGVRNATRAGAGAPAVPRAAGAGVHDARALSRAHAPARSPRASRRATRCAPLTALCAIGFLRHSAVSGAGPGAGRPAELRRDDDGDRAAPRPARRAGRSRRPSTR